VNVREAEFPILVRLVNTFEKSLSLFIFRQVQEKFNDPRASGIVFKSFCPTGRALWLSFQSSQ
jgi:hypothetical protein